MSKQTLVVIGGGAAGFFCAVNAAAHNPHLSVTIVEKSSKLLSKVKVSGGGRCNVTHNCFEIPLLITKYPRGTNFLKKSLHLFNTCHTIDWFAERGVAIRAEADGRMFPATNSSQTIIDCLLREADRLRVNIVMGADIKTVQPNADEFAIEAADGRRFAAHYVCIACGGFPKADHFTWLSALGHSFLPPVPSLFTFNIPGHGITQLMGVSVENAIVKITGSKLLQQGPVLITHWGLSGPAVLKLSAYGARELWEKAYEFSVLVNWLPAYTDQTLLAKWPVLQQELSALPLHNKNPFGLPARLWLFFLGQAQIAPDTRWDNINAKNRNKLIQLLTASQFAVKGKTTFKEEFVTCGGIQLSEIEPSTMQSRKVPNLYFAGEIMDVDGITGGFNFQHAWSSGWIAAKAIGEKSLQASASNELTS